MGANQFEFEVPRRELQASPRRTAGDFSSRPASDAVQVDSRDIMKNIFYIQNDDTIDLPPQSD